MRESCTCGFYKDAHSPQMECPLIVGTGFEKGSPYEPDAATKLHAATEEMAYQRKRFDNLQHCFDAAMQINEAYRHQLTKLAQLNA